MKIETIHTEGITCRYFRFGKENAAPFVIIPGVAVKSVMNSADVIATQYKELSREHDIYVIDRIEDMPEGYTVQDMACDTIKVLHAIGIRNADIYGVSQGGMIAQVIALECPEIVRRLILCSTSPYIPEASTTSLRVWAENAQKKDTESLMLAFAENIYTKDYFEKFRTVFREYSRLLTDEDLQRFLRMISATHGFDIRDRLGEIKCPVLVMAADNDRIFGTVPSGKIAELTDGTLHIYKDQAHGVYDEEPDVLKRIKEFIS